MSKSAGTTINAPVACGVGIGALAEDAVIRPCGIFRQGSLPSIRLKAFRADADASFLMRQAFIRIKRQIAALAIAGVCLFGELPECRGAEQPRLETKEQANDHAAKETVAPMVKYDFGEICHSFILGLVFGALAGLALGTILTSLQNSRMASEIKELKQFLQEGNKP